MIVANILLGMVEPVLAIGAFALVAIGAIVLSKRAEKKRRDALHQVATEMGLGFFPEGGQGIRESFSHAKLFNKGRGRTVKNVIHGQTEEVTVDLFDYFFTTGSGKNRRTHYQTVASFRSPKLMLPQFSLRPQSAVFDSIGRAFGGQDIDFEEYPDFSRRFVLQGEEELAVRGQFSHALLRFFEQNQGICVEGSGQQFLFYRPRRRIKPHEMRTLFTQAFEAYSVLQMPTVR